MAPSGVARTGKSSCRRPAEVIVVDQTTSREKALPRQGASRSRPEEGPRSCSASGSMGSFHPPASNRGIRATILASAIGRLGKPLLAAYAVLLIVGVAAVVGCVFWMFLGTE